MSAIKKHVRIGDCTRFKKGNQPWNKGMKGINLSPRTQWEKGCESSRKMPLGSVTIRHRKREKNPRAWVKISEPNVWVPRARHVFEEVNGPLRVGLVIHHIDRDPLNDTIENLQAMTRSEHAREHEEDLRGARNA